MLGDPPQELVLKSGDGSSSNPNSPTSVSTCRKSWSCVSDLKAILIVVPSFTMNVFQTVGIGRYAGTSKKIECRTENPRQRTQQHHPLKRAGWAHYSPPNTGGLQMQREMHLACPNDYWWPLDRG